MQNLWAPWRIEYIKNITKKEKSCFLCQAFNGNPDEAKLIIHRGKECFSILNRYPYNNGHMMVVPTEHKPDISDLTDSETLEIMKLSSDMKKLLTETITPDGFNLGINLGKTAGAGLLGHLHIHIVPRWDGDTNFMPVLSDVKVIPQSLEDLARELKDHLKTTSMSE